MVGFLLEDGNFPFAVSLGLMIAISLLEGVGMLFGAAFSSVLDSLLPDVDLNVDVEMNQSTSLTKLLGFLRVGSLPILVVLIAFLTSFGLVGIFLQSLVSSVSGSLLPSWIAAPIALVVTLPCVRVVATGLSRIFPKDETEAVTSGSFVGRVAVITQGSARRGAAAEAKLKDAFGKTHYVLVEPEAHDDEFSGGQQILLVRQDGSRFFGIHATSEALIQQ